MQPHFNNPYSPPEFSEDAPKRSWSWLRYIPATFLFALGCLAICWSVVGTYVCFLKREMFYQRDGEVMVLALPTLFSAGILWTIAFIDLWRQNYVRGRQLAWSGFAFFALALYLLGRPGIN